MAQGPQCRLHELLRTQAAAVSVGQQIEQERELLDEFLLLHAQRYDFSHRAAGAAFGTTIQLLVQERFLSRANWERLQPHDWGRLRVHSGLKPLADAHIAEVVAANHAMSSPHCQPIKNYICQEAHCAASLIESKHRRSFTNRSSRSPY